jgi:hypothetical protein
MVQRHDGARPFIEQRTRSSRARPGRERRSAFSQSRPIDDRDRASFYGNQVVVRPHAQCFGNRSPAHAEHNGQELVREKKLIAVDAIRSASPCIVDDLEYAPCNGRAGVPSELAETATHNADRLHAFRLQDSVVAFHLVRQCAPASRHSQESGAASDRNTSRHPASMAVRCISSALCCGDHGGSLLFRREHDRSA